MTFRCALEKIILAVALLGAVSFWLDSEYIRTDIFKIHTIYAATETFTTSGSWQAPTGVTSVTVELWGGGGGGAGGSGGNGTGGGGGAGGQYAKKVVSVTSGNTYSYTVGAGGNGGASTVSGSAGGDTTFNSTTVVAKGGVGGTRYADGGGGGTGSVTGGLGDTIYAGGSGASGSTSYGGGGGSGAGSTGTGNNASTYTGGSAKTENGGGGGNGSSSNNSPGIAGNTYGGGGGAGTKVSSGGSGAAGFVRLIYNTPPTFTVVPYDSPDPVTQGNDVTFSGTATDSESNSWYLAVCNTNSITAGSPPTCDVSQTYCISSSAVSSASQNTCVWTSSDTGIKSWYAFACDNASTNPRCSSASTTNSPVTVNAPAVYSVSISPGGTIVYGDIEVGQSKNTIDITSTQTATNDGTATENLNIKTSVAVNGVSWDIGSSPGANIFVHEFSINSGQAWTKFITADSYQTLSSGLAVLDSVAFDLRITAPTSSDSQQKTITVTIQAIAP